MATVKFLQHIDVDNKSIIGDLNVPISLTVTGERVTSIADIAAAGTATLWTTPSGGITVPDVIIVQTTANVWVELRNDHSGAAEFILFEVTASNPLVLTSPDIGFASSTQIDGTPFAANTEFGQVDSIAVQNDTAATARVTLILID